MKQINTVLSAFLLLILMSFSSGDKFGKILSEFHNANTKYILVTAHRSAHNGYPENSISALKHAIKLGVDIAETDVKVTKDSVVVLMHDGKIDRTTNGTGDPENYTLAELKKFRLKMPDGTLTDETIPTFEEFLKVAKGQIMVDIDIKTSYLKPVVDVVKKTGTQNQVFYFDDDYESLKKVLSLDPGSMLMPRAHSYHEADSALIRFKPQAVHIDESFYTKEVTGMIKGQKAKIWINALDNADKEIRKGNIEQAMNTLLINQANIIQTDEPEKILEYLRSKKLHD